MSTSQNYTKSFHIIVFHFILISGKAQTCQGWEGKGGYACLYNHTGYGALRKACRPIWFGEDFICAVVICFVGP